MSYHDAMEWLGRVDRHLVEQLLDILEERSTQTWRARAACRDTSPAVFHPPRGANRSARAEACAICASCPVRSECLEASVGVRTGIWAGAGERARRGQPRTGDASAA